MRSDDRGGQSDDERSCAHPCHRRMGRRVLPRLPGLYGAAIAGDQGQTHIDYAAFMNLIVGSLALQNLQGDYISNFLDYLVD